MFGGSVLGLSSLRQREAKSNEPSEQSKQMQAYLAKYTGEKKSESGKTKKKERKVVANQPGGIRILEENNTGFRNHATEEVVEDEGKTRPLMDLYKLGLRQHEIQSTAILWCSAWWDNT